MSSIGEDASKRVDLNYKLFKGASIQFKDLDKAEDRAAKIAGMASVKNVWPVKLYSVPQHTVHSVGSDAEDGGLRRRQATGNDTFTPHVMTQVNMLREKGVTGKGIKIAIIDTGVSWRHSVAPWLVSLTWDIT
jgi:subtilisin family serine protease